MADNNPNQQGEPASSGNENLGRNQYTSTSAQPQKEEENAQDGTHWANYRTRELASNDESQSDSGTEEKGQ